MKNLREQQTIWKGSPVFSGWNVLNPFDLLNHFLNYQYQAFARITDLYNLLEELAFKDGLHSNSKDFSWDLIFWDKVKTRCYILPFHALLLILFSKCNHTKTFIPINAHSEKDTFLSTIHTQQNNNFKSRICPFFALKTSKLTVHGSILSLKIKNHCIQPVLMLQK